MNKIIVFLITMFLVGLFSIGVSIGLSALYESAMDGPELFNSFTLQHVVGQLMIFLVFSLVFTFQKMKYKQILSLFLIFAILLILADILISGLSNVRWNATINMLTILIAPFAGIFFLKKVGEIQKKSIEEAEKEN